MLDVFLSVLGQLLEGLARRDVLALPAGKLLVDGLRVEQHALLHGEVVVALAVAFVGHAHLDGVEGGKHIELGQRHISEAVDLRGVARDDRVEPAAAALAASGHAVFVAHGAQKLASFCLFAHAAVLGEALLGGERAAADARYVRLLDTEHAVDVHRAHARARRRAARAARRGGHIGIRAVIDVEQGALRALEQHRLTLAQRAVEHVGGFSHIGLQDARVRQVLLTDFLDRVGVEAVDLAQDGILLLERGLDLQAEDLLVEQILDADALASSFVLVARADAALGGADLVLAEALLVGAVEVFVPRHDDMRVAADLQVLARNALGLEHRHFLHEHARVDNDAVADDGNGVLVHDTRGHQVQRQFLVTVNNGVSCVVSTLVAHDVVVLARNEVGDFTLAFVAPLGTDENCTGHERSSFRRPARARPIGILPATLAL